MQTLSMIAKIQILFLTCNPSIDDEQRYSTFKKTAEVRKTATSDENTYTLSTGQNNF